MAGFIRDAALRLQRNVGDHRAIEFGHPQLQFGHRGRALDEGRELGLRRAADELRDGQPGRAAISLTRWIQEGARTARPRSDAVERLLERADKLSALRLRAS